MTVESTLQQELSICYIDARNLVTSAKLNLGIFGYANTEQNEMLIQEAQRIFFASPLNVQESMQERNESLEASIRQLAGSSCHSTNTTDSSDDWETSFSSSTRSSTSVMSVSSTYYHGSPHVSRSRRKQFEKSAKKSHNYSTRSAEF